MDKLMLFKRKNAVVGLDIGSSSIKAIEMTSMGNEFVITGYGQTPFPEDGENVSEVINNLLQSNNFKSKRVITSVSGREVIVRYISMQPVDAENLNNAVKFEADKYIPYDLAEVVLDSQALDESSFGTVSSAEMKVLLVAAKRSLIEQRVQLIKDSSLAPDVIDVDCFALGNAFELRNILSPRAEVENRVVSLIDIGASKTNITIMIGNTSFFTREIYLAGNEFTEEIQRRMDVDIEIAEKLKRKPNVYALEIQEAVASVVDDLANEITLSFDFFESQFEREVEEIYVSGGGSQFFSLEPDFERVFGKRINRWNPTKYFQINEDQVDVESLKANAPQLAIVMGLASRIRTN